MEKGICYSASGLIEYVPFDDEKYDVLLEYLGKEVPSYAEVLVMHERGLGFLLSYKFLPKKITDEEL